MKFIVTFKTPDAVGDSARRAYPKPEDGDDEQAAEERQIQIDYLEEFASEWVKYGEYVAIEFDTEAGTATVLPAN